jgi:hypothetical protein
MSLDDIVSFYNHEPVKPRANAIPLPQKPLLAASYDATAKFNATVPEGRQVLRSTVREVINREAGTSEFNIQRAVNQLFSTIENPGTKTPTKHTDLLPKGHPLNVEWVSTYNVRDTVAQYFSADPRLPSDAVRSLVASAISAPPESASRLFYIAQAKSHANDLTIDHIIDDAEATIASK